jgi:hypothetical protein
MPNPQLHFRTAEVQEVQSGSLQQSHPSPLLLIPNFILRLINASYLRLGGDYATDRNQLANTCKKSFIFTKSMIVYLICLE